MFLADPITVLLLVLLCLLLLKITYGSTKKPHPNFPPGPKPLPVIGNMHILDPKRPHLTFLELAKQYGPVFSVYIGPHPIVVLCGCETVKDALINQAEEFSDRPHIPIYDDICRGYGILFANGDNWKVMRRFTVSTLKDYGMGKKSIEGKINEECEYLVKRIKSFGGKPFDNTMVLSGASANIIVSIMLGHRFDYEEPIFVKLMSLMHENIRLIGSPMVELYNTFHAVMRWLPGSHKTVIQNSAEMEKFFVETFTQYKEELDVNDQRNLIDSFLTRQQEKSDSAAYFHNGNLASLIANLFGAGMDTTATTLQWGLLLMIKYPEIQQSVHDEIDKVIGSAVPRGEHRKEMPYTDAVIHEIQRFSNIVPNNMPRATTTDVSFKGYVLPKGTFVIPVLTSVLQDKDYFEKPREFYPQHFLDANGHFLKNEAFLPFSAGKRSCAGENLAKMELFLFFTTLLQNFTFHIPPGAKVDLTPDNGTSAPPMYHEICAVPRSS